MTYPRRYQSELLLKLATFEELFELNRIALVGYVFPCYTIDTQQDDPGAQIASEKV